MNHSHRVATLYINKHGFSNIVYLCTYSIDRSKDVMFRPTEASAEAAAAHRPHGQPDHAPRPAQAPGIQHPHGRQVASR